MYSEFDCCQHHYRVLSNGMTLRKNLSTGTAEGLSLSLTQRRIMNELVRVPSNESPHRRVSRQSLPHGTRVQEQRPP